jgi:hypothetical protein
MSFTDINDIIVKNSGFNHIKIKTSESDYTLTLDNGSISSVSSEQEPLDLVTRASFSHLEDVYKASSESSQAIIEALDKHEGELSSWKRAYFISSLADLADLITADTDVEASSKPLNENEKILVLKGLKNSELLYEAEQESNRREDLLRKITNDPESLNSATYKDLGCEATTDESFFIILAATGGVTVGKSLRFAAGFQISRIFAEAISLIESGRLSIVNSDGEPYELRSNEPKSEEAHEDVEEENHESDESDLTEEEPESTFSDVVIPETPSVVDEQPQSEESNRLSVPDLSLHDEASPDDHEDSEEPESDGLDFSLSLKSENANEDPSEPVVETPVEEQTEVHQEAVATVDPEGPAVNDGDAISGLLQNIIQAKNTLQALKAQKTDVDSKLAQLPDGSDHDVDHELSQLSERRDEIKSSLQSLQKELEGLDDKEQQLTVLKQSIGQRGELESRSHALDDDIARLEQGFKF